MGCGGYGHAEEGSSKTPGIPSSAGDCREPGVRLKRVGITVSTDTNQKCYKHLERFSLEAFVFVDFLLQRFLLIVLKVKQIYLLLRNEED